MSLPSCRKCGSNNPAKSHHECKECAWVYQQEQEKRAKQDKGVVDDGSPIDEIKLHVEALAILVEHPQVGDRIWDHAFRLTTKKINSIRKKILGDVD